MIDPTSASERLAAAEVRLIELARQKSRLELLNTMLTRLTAVTGLANMVQHILQILLETIGAANIHICYRIGSEWHCVDLLGEETTDSQQLDPRIETVLASGEPERFGAPPVAGPGGDLATETWIFPLICRERTVGAVVLEQMQLTQATIMDDLLPFFTYAALMLDNEINNYSQLEASHLLLQKSESVYRTLFEQLPSGVVLYDPESLRPRQFNSVAHTQLGYSREEFASLTVMDIEAVFSPDDLAVTSERIRNEGTVTFETMHRTKSGELRNTFVSIRLFTAGDEPLILAIHRDITTLKQATERMQLLDFALNNVQEAMYLIDANARLQYVNREASKQLGYTSDQLLTMAVFDFDPDFPRERWPDHWNELRTARSMIFESRHQRQDGTILPVEICATIIVYNSVEYMLSLVRDISERMKSEEERLSLERQLLQAQKMESLGVLAGGIAHDFNNILTAIIGNADIALMKLSAESPAIDNLRRIENAASRAADLAKQMLAYSGKGRFVVEEISLNRLIEEMLHLLEVSISKKAFLRLNLDEKLPPIKADPTQIRQIIMNLVINASEAIGEKSGVIAITTSSLQCDAVYLQSINLLNELPEGLYVALEIADSGCGMSRETLARLFDPFFTTKFTGRGLGMSAVLGILRGHEGAIKVYSEEGKGTTFRILLPATLGKIALEPAEKQVENVVNTGVVLLVDDEPTIRSIGAELLTHLGYAVITAADGREALEIFRSRDDISFLILDLTMPKMDGEQCFRELRLLKPDVRVIITSGYSEQEVSEKFIGKGVVGFIQKPYKLSSLREVIRSMRD